MPRIHGSLQWLLLFFVALSSTCTSAQDQAEREYKNAPADWVVEKNVGVPMRDGVILRADLYRPAETGRFPTLVYRTPYSKEHTATSYSTVGAAVKRGYAVLVQDVRGRYRSDGEFSPYINEGQDGYDTIEWAAKQEWSDGKVGTFGLSYPGAVQWLAAIENPPSLKAMVPAMTFSTPRNFFYSGGVFDLSWASWIWNNIAPDLRVRKKLPGPKTDEEAASSWAKISGRVVRQRPLFDLPDLKDVAPFYYEWLKHPPEDSYWDFAELRGRYAKTSVAVLNYSGWYDEAYGPDGAFTNFNGLITARKTESDRRTQVVVGPWIHGSANVTSTRAGDREFGGAAAIDYDALILDWMDHYVRGIDNGVAARKPVRVFVMGANRWREADSWPLPQARPSGWYLVPEADKKNGTLQNDRNRKKESFTEFLSDPADPVIDMHADTRGAHDYSLLANRPDVIVYDSAPLSKATEVTGPINVQLYISVDAPDTDIWARLLDVAPDGTAHNLMAPGLDVLRVSYREGGARKLLVPGEVYKLEFKNLVTSNVFKAGHRVRVQISTSFHPHFSHNLHTGEPESFSAKARRATIRIYHDEKRPSRVLLPVIPESK